MPIYTIYHRSTITRDFRKQIADYVTKVHCELTGALPDVVKVMFLELDLADLFIAGKTVRDYVRVVGQIRAGRSDDVKTQLMRRIYTWMRTFLPKGEIQVQLVEIDDTKTVMTNGVLNSTEPGAVTNDWNMSSETLVPAQT